jgi:hypothetical protein
MHRARFERNQMTAFSFVYRGVACLLMLVIGLPCFSQTGATGALSVSIANATGAMVPGATVTVSNAAGLIRTETTNASGSYTFQQLPPGTYKVKIVANGFATIEAPSITVSVTETSVVNQTLVSSSQTQQITVTTEAQTTQTESTTLCTVVGQRANYIAAIDYAKLHANFSVISRCKSGCG